MKKNLLLLSITVVATLLLYQNILYAPFVFDDHHSIVNNLRLHDPMNFVPPVGPRDVGFLTFALNFALSRFSVFSYHLVNILIHIVNALLVFVLYRSLVKRFSPQSSDGRNFLLAAAISLIFLVHPVQTNAVTYIVQRFTSLAALFYMLSCILYIRASDVFSEKRQFFRPLHLVLYLLSLVSVALAMKTKEITFTLPLMIVLYELLIRLHKGAVQRPPLLYLAPFVMTLLIIPAGIIDTGVTVGEMLGELSDKSMEDRTVPRTDYLFTQFRVIATYLRLLLFPSGQNLDYDYPVFGSLADPAVFLSLLLHLALFGAAVYLFARLRGRDSVVLLVPFGIFWFYLTLSVESSIIPIRDVIFEHRLYLPSAGIIAAFVAGLTAAADKLGQEKGQRAAAVFFVAVVLVLSSATIRRNTIWQSEQSLWEDTVRKSPLKARPHGNLANAYHKAGRSDDAIREYLRAIELRPDMEGTYNNLGNAYKALGRYTDAVSAYIRGIDRNPRFAEAYYNLGVVLNENGEPLKALENLKKAVEINPKLYDAYMTMGNIYDDSGMKGEAFQAYSKSLEINPYSFMTYYNRGVFYEGVGDRENARKDYLRSLELNPAWEMSRKRLQEMGG